MGCTVLFWLDRTQCGGRWFSDLLPRFPSMRQRGGQGSGLPDGVGARLWGQAGLVKSQCICPGGSWDRLLSTPSLCSRKRQLGEGVEGRSVSREKWILPWNRQPLHPSTPILSPSCHQRHSFLPPLLAGGAQQRETPCSAPISHLSSAEPRVASLRGRGCM